jgi:hypothetical protein
MNKLQARLIGFVLGMLAFVYFYLNAIPRTR